MIRVNVFIDHAVTFINDSYPRATARTILTDTVGRLKTPFKELVRLRNDVLHLNDDGWKNRHRRQQRSTGPHTQQGFH